MTHTPLPPITPLDPCKTREIERSVRMWKQALREYRQMSPSETKDLLILAAEKALLSDRRRIEGEDYW